MMALFRKYFSISLFVCTCSGVSAQSLFTVDGSGISKEEFLRAYSKNNNTAKPTNQSYKDYLELYIRYKLKVKAAYDARMDTLASQKAELQNFRSQVAETYLKDEASLDKLVKEAFERGQKDVHLAHIFIALPKNPTPLDTARAYEKAMTAYNALKRVKNFAGVAGEYSDDPSAKRNGGDIGYITVFTLPYELETLAYSTPVNGWSKPWRSKGGYHIFKNLGERKSLGRMKAAQILFSFPPDATEAIKFEIHHKADSVYNLLIHGADFTTLAKTYSGDNLSYQNGGEMPEFGIGKYDSAFEAAAFSLDRDGVISHPILSTYGYHIIRRIARVPFPTTLNEPAIAIIKQQVQNDPRVEISRKALFNRIFQQIQLTRADIPEADCWAFTDSVLLNPGLNAYKGINNTTVLFNFARQSYTVKGWLDYVRTVRPSRAPGGARVYKDLFEKYLERMALDYYRGHLEEYNKDFAFQLTEFKEGNLLFEVMQKNIWDKASTDSAGLHNYYNGHKDRYWWESSADALLFTYNSQKAAEDGKAKLQSNGFNWRKLMDSAGMSMQADSGRYEWTQLPGGGSAVRDGQFTDLISNKTDNTVSFAYVLHVYNGRTPRNYKDARGFVINDYQNFLEDQWVADLKKKYPVHIEETVLASLSK